MNTRYPLIYSLLLLGALLGASGTATAQAPPVISLAPHHEGMLVPSGFEATLAHITPSYVSLDVPRSVGLFYSGAQASPRVLVQVDASLASVDPIERISIALVDSAGRTVRLSNGQTENFYQAIWAAAPPNEPPYPLLQRLAAQFDATSLPTAAYRYSVIVRSWSGRRFRADTASVRVLVVNERASVLGSGWSVAGLPRAYTLDSLVMITDGSGGALVFDEVCAPTCAFATPDGDFSTLTREGSDLVRRLVDGTRLRFAPTGHLATATDRFGTQVIYGYDAAGRISTITDPVGKQTVFAYDPATGKLSSITDPGGRVTRIQVDRNGDLVQVTDPDGVPALRVAYSQHRAQQWWDRRGSGFGFGYDRHGMLSQESAPAASAADPVRPITRYVSLAASLLPPAGRGTFSAPLTPLFPSAVWAATISPRGDTTTILLNKFGQATSVIDPVAGTRGAVYDEHGRVTWSRVTAAFNVVREDVVSGYSTDRMNPFPTTVTTTRRTTPENSITVTRTYAYEPLYYQVQRIGTEGLGPQRFFYSGAAAVLDSVRVDSVPLIRWNEQTQKDDTLALEGHKTTKYSHDSYGRVTSVTDPRDHTSSIEYFPTELRNVHATIDAANRRSELVYDSLGRVRHSINPRHDTTSIQYDLLNRVVESSAAELTVAHSYDDRKGVYTVTDPRNLVYHTYTNGLGWDTAYVDPLGGVEKLEYDRYGNLTRFTNRRGQEIAYEYDRYDRLRTRTQLADSGAVTTWDYDPNVLAGQWSGVSNVESADTVKSWGGLVVDSVITRRGTLRYPQAFTYDALANRSKLDVWGYSNDPPRSHWWARDYKSNGLRLNFFRPNNQVPGETGIYYDEDGLLRTLTLPFSPRGWEVREHSITHAPTAAQGDRPNGSIIERYFTRGYQADELDRIEERTAGQFERRIRTHEYDELGQLRGYIDVFEEDSVEWQCVPQDPGPEYCAHLVVSTSAPDTMASRLYTYDDAGNRTDLGAVIPGGSNRVTQFNGFTLAYDADGNVTRKHFTADSTQFNQRLTWNSLGELVGAATTRQGTTTTATYGYDGHGRRVRKTVNGVTTRFVYDGDHLLLQLDAAGAVQREYSYLPGVDQPHLVIVPGAQGQDQAYYYQMEEPGHVVSLTNAQGVVVNEYRYDPWGKPIDTHEFIAQPLRFGGREYDAETGLYFHRARYYDPELGRFLSEDPIGLAGGVNPYLYAANDPANLRDPSGLLAECDQEYWGFPDEDCMIALAGVTGGGGSDWADEFYEWANLEYRGWGTSGALDAAQAGLDVIGLIPGAGEPVDLLNAGISFARGEHGAGGLRLAAAVPIIGIGATLGKFGMQVRPLAVHFSLLEKYGAAGYRTLQNGRMRYYGEIAQARTAGEMLGRRLVREWNPTTSAMRTWHETIDHAGRVRIVRPETGGAKVHYLFDQGGNYVGRR